MTHITYKIIHEVLDQQSHKSKTILDLYYGIHATNKLGYTEIAHQYQDSKQNVLNTIKRFVHVIQRLFQGNTFKTIEVPEEVILWYKKSTGALSKEKYLSVEALETLLDLELSDSYFINILLDVMSVQTYQYKEDFKIFALDKESIKCAKLTHTGLLNILGTNIFWLNKFDLLVKCQKGYCPKMTLSDLESVLCNMTCVESNMYNEYRLKFEYLSSLEKKGLRILEDERKPIHRSELTRRLSLFEQREIIEESLINVFSSNDHVVPVGKTGHWTLTKYKFDTRNQIEVIEQMFVTNNPKKLPLSPREIYSRVCLERKDITIQKISSYLNSKKERFHAIGPEKYIISSWYNQYSKQIQAYQNNKESRSRFDAVTKKILSDRKSCTVQEITSSLTEEGINLSTERIRILLQVDYVHRYKQGRQTYYQLKNPTFTQDSLNKNRVLEILQSLNQNVINNKKDNLFYVFDAPKSEAHLKIDFAEHFKGHFELNNIEVSINVFTKPGLVHFKFSDEEKSILLVDLKLASNKKAINDFKTLLQKHCKNNQITHGLLILIAYHEKELENIRKIENDLKQLEIEYGIHLDVHTFNAQK